jgi:LAO/AO transport system kinase
VRRAPRTVEEYRDGVLAGDRRALAKAITLIESRRPDQVQLGHEVVQALLPHSGASIRLGITGPPGVGKSTFIEALGLELTGQGHRLAVLAIDPSSPVSGGSILGDKTRMAELAKQERAFIRPSPSGGTLGGVAHRTRETLLICEAAGFDAVVVETVGVGQSEAEVASMVDFFALLVQPGAGDELQGIKKGALELADALVVTKADGASLELAMRTQAEYAHAMELLRPTLEEWRPPVLRCSSRSGEGIVELWDRVLEHRRILSEAGRLEARRRAQTRAWFWALVEEGLRAALTAAPATAGSLPELERQVADRERSAPNAARALLDAFLGARP